METYQTKLNPVNVVALPKEGEAPAHRESGRYVARRTLAPAALTSGLAAGDIASNAITQIKMADDSIGQAELKTNIVAVTVNAGASTGTATVTSGAIIIGWRATGNQDQFVDNISISGTTLTITLGANATADNTFQVTLLET